MSEEKEIKSSGHIVYSYDFQRMHCQHCDHGEGPIFTIGRARFQAWLERFEEKHKGCKLGDSPPQ
jgi:hypothetical protein